MRAPLDAGLAKEPYTYSHQAALDEMEAVAYSTVENVLQKTHIHANEVGQMAVEPQQPGLG